MIAAEMDSRVAVVRIHDEYYVKEPENYMAQMNQIVSNAYRRRSVPSSASVNCHACSIDTTGYVPV